MSVRCEESGCRLFASFGYPGGPRVRCRTHKLETMVRGAASLHAAARDATGGCARTWCTWHAVLAVFLQEDVTHRRCEEDGCQTQASFGYPGGPRARCRTHALESMVRRRAAVRRTLLGGRLMLRWHWMHASKLLAGYQGVVWPRCEDPDGLISSWPTGRQEGRCDMHRLKAMVRALAPRTRPAARVRERGETQERAVQQMSQEGCDMAVQPCAACMARCGCLPATHMVRIWRRRMLVLLVGLPC